MMITSLQLGDFKNFANETLRVGPFTVIVGTNASGKSNIRDAFRFLHGIGRGYDLEEIIGGSDRTGSRQIEWAPIRGGTNEITRLGQSGFSLLVKLTINECEVEYSIAVESDGGSRTWHRIVAEGLKFGSKYIYWSRPYNDHGPDLILHIPKSKGCLEFNEQTLIRSDRPILTEISEYRNVQHVIDAFDGIRFLDPLPEVLREPAFPSHTVLGNNGENLPTVLQEICSNPNRAATLYEWVRELTPMDVKNFSFKQDQFNPDQIQFWIGEMNNRVVSAYSASDGTLRFLAILAALLGKQIKLSGKNAVSLFFFEEIDNGIHPSRLHLLLDLIEGQTKKSGIQVVTTTHSPDLLTMMNDDTFANTSVVCRLPETDNAVIYPVCELPHSKELRNSHGLGRLHTSGWIEEALAFAKEGGEWTE